MIEDWEYESQKDYIYLLEAQMEMEKEFFNPEYGQILVEYELRQMETN